MPKRMRAKQKTCSKREWGAAQTYLIPPPNSFSPSSHLRQTYPKKNKRKQIHHQQSRSCNWRGSNSLTRQTSPWDQYKPARADPAGLNLPCCWPPQASFHVWLSEKGILKFLEFFFKGGPGVGLWKVSHSVVLWHFEELNIYWCNGKLSDPGSIPP